MDIIALAGMLFSLLVVLIIAGSILMFPIMRRLGRLIEVRIEERRSGTVPAEDMQALLESVRALEAEVLRLTDRQAFTERLLEGNRSRTSERTEPSESTTP